MNSLKRVHARLCITLHRYTNKTKIDIDIGACETRTKHTLNGYAARIK